MQPWERHLVKLWLLAFVVGGTADALIMWAISHWHGDPGPVASALIGLACVPIAGFFIIPRGMKGHLS